MIGSTGGLGAASALRLGRRTPVILGYHNNSAKADELAGSIRERGGEAHTEQVDVTDPSSISNFLTGAEKQLDGLDAIVLSTGASQIPFGPMTDIPADDFRRILEIDVLGAFHVLQQGAKLLGASGGGSIVVFLTVAVLHTMEHDGMSAIPKSAVAAMVQQVAREEGPKAVRVNGVAPGLINAGAVQTVMVSEEARAIIQKVLDVTPLSRMGLADEIGAAVDFLCSPDSGFITGQIIAVDGGFSS